MESAPDTSPCSCCSGASAFSTCATQTLQLVSRRDLSVKGCIQCAALDCVDSLSHPRSFLLLLLQRRQGVQHLRSRSC